MTKNTKRKIIFSLFFIFTIGMSFSTYVSVKSRIDFVNNSFIGSGKVIDIKVRSGTGDDPDSKYPVIEYEVNGTKKSFVSSSGNTSIKSYAIGQVVPLRISDTGGKAVLNTFSGLWLGSVIVGVIALASLLMLGQYIYSYVRYPNLYFPKKKNIYGQKPSSRKDFLGKSVFLCNEFWSVDDKTVQLFGESMKDILRPGMKILINGAKVEILEVFGSDKNPDKPTESASPLVKGTPIIVESGAIDWESVAKRQGEHPQNILPLELVDDKEKGQAIF